MVSATAHNCMYNIEISWWIECTIELEGVKIYNAVNTTKRKQHKTNNYEEHTGQTG